MIGVAIRLDEGVPVKGLLHTLPQDSAPLAVNDAYRVCAVSERPIKELFDRDSGFVGAHPSDMELVTHHDGFEIIVDASGWFWLLRGCAFFDRSQAAHVQGEPRVAHDDRSLAVGGVDGLHRALHVEAHDLDDVA